jgi:hypothetical protein
MATGLFLDMIYHQTFRHYVIHVADLTKWGKGLVVFVRRHISPSKKLFLRCD